MAERLGSGSKKAPVGMELKLDEHDDGGAPKEVQEGEKKKRGEGKKGMSKAAAGHSVVTLSVPSSHPAGARRSSSPGRTGGGRTSMSSMSPRSSSMVSITSEDDGEETFVEKV